MEQTVEKLVEAINKRNELIYAMLRNTFNYPTFMLDKSINIDSLYKLYKAGEVTNNKMAKDRIKLLNSDSKK